MKYEKFIKIAVGVIAVATLFVLPTLASATTPPTPVITSVAGDTSTKYINLSESTDFTVVGTSESTSTVTINLADTHGHSATSTPLVMSTTAYTVHFGIASSTPSLTNGDTITVTVFAHDTLNTATSSAATTAVLDITPPTLTARTILSNNASSTLAKADDVVTLYATTSEAVTPDPLVVFTFNGVTSASSSVLTALTAGRYYKSTVAASTTDTDGVVAFSIGSFSDVAGNAVVASSTTVTAGAGVTFDKTAPTISSVVWNDVNGSTNIDATAPADTITITFSEWMATSTATSTSLGLSAGTFGNSTLAWSLGTTTLTITLGSTATIVSGDTINPTNATDFVGNAYSTATHAITDSTGPSTPVASLAAGTYTSSQTTTLSSTGSSNIYYTVDGSTPSCSSILYNGSFVIIGRSLTLEVVGCDALLNTSSVLSVDYAISNGGGGSGSGGGGWRNPNAATPAIPAVPGVSPAVPAVPAHKALSMTLSRDLSVGSEGNDVVALQTFLESSGYLVMPNGVAKGYFGALTRKAVMKFQKDVGLPTPGRVGPATRGILNRGI